MNVDTKPNQTSGTRAAWADFAKGLTIILVVMMHSTLGVELALGKSAFMGDVVTFARSFRMPLFFAISGLFAAAALNRSWLKFADVKLIHFAYFYVLWSILQIGVRLALAGHGQHDISWHQFALIPVSPFGTIWFIYILPLFFLVARFSRAVPPLLVFGAAALMSVFQTHGSGIVVDSFTKYLVFFLGGLYAGPWIKALAAWAHDKVLGVTGLCLAFAAANLQVMAWGQVEHPAFALAMGCFGAATMVALSSLVGHYRLFAPVRYCGQNSLAIYVAFTFPMVAARIIGTKTGVITDPDLLSAFVLATAVAGALAMAWTARRVGLSFLFDRPAAFHLERAGVSDERLAKATRQQAVN
ncbi:MAG: acyltransferase family protein [Alphaproteobacteria bacterium]|nr:acyltransferase family protein [Alphaproteobacteria bacterium]